MTVLPSQPKGPSCTVLRGNAYADATRARRPDGIDRRRQNAQVEATKQALSRKADTAGTGPAVAAYLPIGEGQAARSPLATRHEHGLRDHASPQQWDRNFLRLFELGRTAGMTFTRLRLCLSWRVPRRLRDPPTGRTTSCNRGTRLFTYHAIVFAGGCEEAACVCLCLSARRGPSYGRFAVRLAC